MAKATASRASAFVPVEINLTLESQREVEALHLLCKNDISVPEVLSEDGYFTEVQQILKALKVFRKVAGIE